tara:strand:+ start:432 stop:1049 length:618 start_codon:yes stop_codon:yes gene_type:complete
MNKKYFDTRKDSLEDKINTIASEQSSITQPITDTKLAVDRKYFETKPGSLADAAVKIVSEGMDPVNKDAVKKKFDDRKDKDIDNDGDTDSSDKFLHKRRKAISKAMKEDNVDEACWDSHKQVGTKMKGGKQVPNCVPKNEAVNQDDHGEKTNQDKKDAAMKKTDQKKPFNKLRQETKLVRLGNNGKTDTGQKAAVIDLEPSARPI